MEQKKVIFHLIRALSPDERLAFRRKLPCSKTNKTALRVATLFEYFEKRIVRNTGIESLDASKMISLLDLPETKRLGPYYEELITALQDFLIQKELNNHYIEKQVLLQSALVRREENVYVQELHTHIREYIKDFPLPMPKEYLSRSLFYNNLYTHISTDTYKSDALVYLHQSENNLDIFYWIEKLRLLVKKANRAVVISSEEYLLKELPILPDLTVYTQYNKFHILNIYVNVYQFALNPFQSEELDEVIDLIKSTPIIPKEDQERILNYLNNLVSYYINSNSSNKCNLSSKDIYKVYALGFCNLWLIQKDGRILFEDFMNILKLAFFNKDFEFLASISADYEAYIPIGYEPFVEMLAKGYNFFLHRKWAAVIKTFSNQDSPPKPYTLHYILQRNMLKIKALFESLIQDKKELDDIPNILEKHYKFVQREFKISDIGKERSLNFVKILKKIFPYLAKRIDFRFDKKIVKEEISEWIAEVESLKGQTIELEWLQSVGERLLAEVQK